MTQYNKQERRLIKQPPFFMDKNTQKNFFTMPTFREKIGTGEKNKGFSF